MNYTTEIPSTFDTLEYVLGSFAMNEIGDCISKFICTVGEVKYDFMSIYHYKDNEKSSDVIISKSREFVNGFKVVKLADGLYGYVREMDGKLMEPRFTVAGDFNEYGYAMVGIQKGVCWIDKEFKSCSFGKNSDASDIVRWSEYGKEKATFSNIVGHWLNDYPVGVSKFSEGSIPLAGISSKNGSLQFLKSNGEIQSFRKISSSETLHYRLFKESIRNIFNKDGYLTLESGILFSNGFFAPLDVVWNTLRGREEIFTGIAEDVNRTKIGDVPKAFVMLPIEKK